MALLFLDTYYVNGEESFIGIYNIIKDFIVPFLAIGIPVGVTLVITKRDRKKNEDDRRAIINQQYNHEVKYHEKLLTDLDFFNKSAIFNIEKHLGTLKSMIDKCNFEDLPHFSVSLFTNVYINELKSLDYNILRIYIPAKNYIVFINSVDLLSGLYLKLDSNLTTYRDLHYTLHRDLDNTISKIFYKIPQYGFNDGFDKSLLAGLEELHTAYNNFADNYETTPEKISYPKKLSNLLETLIQTQRKNISQYDDLNGFILELELILIKIERFAQHYFQSFNVIYKGLSDNVEILKKFELKIKDLPKE